MKSVLAHDKVTVSKERSYMKLKKQSDDEGNEDGEDVPRRTAKVTKLTLKTNVFV